MHIPSPSTCILMGEEPLLIRCAETLQSHGHTVSAVVAASPQIRSWADANEIECLPPTDYADAVVSRQPDLFVSAANLRIIPERVLDAAGLAINFHDGPLPEYAGLNTPSWAILNGKSEHGITWHVMEASVDTGAILKKSTFPVHATSTAQMLNVMCFEAGVSAFEELVAEMTGPGLTPMPQGDGPRAYFAKKDGPPRGGFVSGEDAATAIDALVRATMFGGGTNRFGTARLWVDGTVYTIGAAEIVDEAATGVSGTVVELRDDAVVLQAMPGRIALRGLKTASGANATPSSWPSTHGVVPGTILHAPSDAEVDAIEAQMSFWKEHLRSAPAPTVLPTPQPETNTSSDGTRLATQSLGMADLHGSDLSLETAVLAAWAVVLNRYTGDRDVVFNVATEAGAAPLRIQLEEGASVESLAERLTSQMDARALHLPSDASAAWGWAGRAHAPTPATAITFAQGARASAPVALAVNAEAGTCSLTVDAAACTLEAADRLLRHMTTALATIVTADRDAPSVSVDQIDMLPAKEKEQLLAAWNDTEVSYDAAPMHTQFEQQVEATPDARALSFGGVTLTYAELNARAEQIATVLQQNGVSAGDRVGVCIPRSLDMVATLYGILKTGAAYVPLDPDYPADRIAFMIEDAGLACIAAASGISIAGGQSDVPCPVVIVDQIADDAPRSVQTVPVGASDIAYVIYTSGSTGKPKGVMVTHGNAANFFAGMDERIVHHDDRPNVWLSVTSISFDISVLELFWTLSRGFEVVLQSGGRTQVAASTAVENQIADAVSSTGDGAPVAAADSTATVERPVAFSLFYFSSDEKLDAPGAQATAKYKMLLDGAEFADRNGFEAVWTPERHFHDFGGLYPNPSVISAAIAARTENVQIRAGSCVSPLHHPVRIAEDWSVVDNLSNGRVGISFAAGWQPNDFVIQPQNFADRKSLMFEQIEDVRALWRGESRTYDGPTGDPVEVQTLPRPVQRDLPVWITAAGNPETFRMAGEGGYNILTHLLGQSVEELTEKLSIYRDAWKKAGHPGNGQATLMLHTFVGDDEAAVKAAVREPMKSYLRSSIALIKKAAWSFPTFKKRTTDLGGGFSLDGLSDEEIDAVLDYAFERYYKNSGLFGTPAQCMDRVAEVTGAGIDEIACLLDFGLPAETVVEHLPHLCEVKDASDAQWAKNAPDAGVNVQGNGQQGDGQPVGSANLPSSNVHAANVPSATPSKKTASVQATIPENIAAYGVTHLQCTPSQARMLVADADTREALQTLDHMMVGGEAFPPALAHQLRDVVSGRVTNMYGPTETTIWSSTWDVTDFDGTVPIGHPIANTSIYLLDEHMRPVPMGVPGALWIGGDGVTLGYLGRETLTAERFVPNPFGDGRLYNTGDVARYAEDGTLHFLGRNDFQVKIRGHRIELGEIEAALETQEGVRSAVVVVRTTGDGQEGSYDQRLVAYLLPTPGVTLDTDALRAALSERLPEIMVPTVYAVVDALPLTPNGKVDRNGLPDPEPKPRERAVQTFEAPTGDTEQVILEIWKSLLDLEHIGVTENFFDIGGHSLLAVQVVRQLGERLNTEVPVLTLFQYPTIRTLSEHLGGSDESAESGATRGQSRAEMRRQRMMRR